MPSLNTMRSYGRQSKHAAADKGGLVLKQGGHCNGTRSFGDGFFLFKQHQDGVCDLFFIDGHQLIDIFRDKRAGHFTRVPNGNSVGDRRGGFERNRLAGRSVASGQRR